MIGAIIGDIVGSKYEFHTDGHPGTKDIDLWDKRFFTDDTVMTAAIAEALLSLPKKAIKYPTKYEKMIKHHVIECMKYFGRTYKGAGYGGTFFMWLMSDDNKPYNSWGNGAAMRISPVAYIAPTFSSCQILAQYITEVIHNHPEGIKGGISTACAAWIAIHNGKEAFKEYCLNIYPEINNISDDDIHNHYCDSFDVSCQGTVPYAMRAVIRSNSFEDAIREAFSYGGDCDTLTCIAGGLAEALYRGVPKEMRNQALEIIHKQDRFGLISKTIVNFEESFLLINTTFSTFFYTYVIVRIRDVFKKYNTKKVLELKK